MKIKLSEIKGMTKRVRESQSPEKLDELAESIQETGGVIVPIKVRKNGKGYTIVYGHRRVAAAKMAGLDEIEAIVEDVSEDALLTQALIENVVREDMPDIQIAKALKNIKEETGASNEVIGAKLGHDKIWVGRHLARLDPELELDEVSSKKLPTQHIEQAVAGTGGDKKLAARVLKKAASEDLTQRNTRRMAEVVREANEFGGARAVNEVLKQQADEILRQAKPVEQYKRPRPTATKVEGEILFQWIRDERVIRAELGLNEISACISAIAMSDEDREMGKKILEKFRDRLVVLLDQMNDVVYLG